MPKYKAYFYTDANYACEDVTAETPEAALELALELNETDKVTCFTRYDERPPVNHIEILDNDCIDLAHWRNDELLYRMAEKPVRDFIALIARMNYDGEVFHDAEPGERAVFVMENNDAVAAISRLIMDARNLQLKLSGGIHEL